LPGPFVLPFDGAPQTLSDSRAQVKLLQRTDTLPGRAVINGVSLPQSTPSSITVDGTVVAQPASAMQPGTYYLEPGNHAIVSKGVGSQIDSNLQADAGRTYVQYYGFEGAIVGMLQPVIMGYAWLQPDAAPDYPAPPDKARVHVIVTNTCGSDVVRVDEATLVTAGVGTSRASFDHAAGSIRINVSSTDGTVADGQVTVSLNAGHYYVVRVLNWGFFDPNFYPCVPDGPRNIEVSSD
jgi:hypothetical protein